MTAYRFCRSDDLGLLAEAHERCRGPEHAGSPSLDRARLKELIREVDLWSSSSMVAFEGREPVGVLLGCKRDAATLVLALRVHPAHRRKGHARHLLTSLSSKLAILGPPRLVAEVPADRPEALALFDACGWRREGALVDFRREKRTQGRDDGGKSGEHPIAPLSIGEALASGLFPTEAESWQRDPAAFERQSDRLRALGFHSDERLEAVVVHRALHARPPGADLEVLALGATANELGRLGLRLLVTRLEAESDSAALVLPRLSRAEIDTPANPLFELLFEPASEYIRFAAEAKSA